MKTLFIPKEETHFYAESCSVSSVFHCFTQVRKKKKKKHIEEIRRRKFSIGGKPNPLIEDLHQAVKNLSAELYTTDMLISSWSSFRHYLVYYLDLFGKKITYDQAMKH
ncbi:hypothetical protein MTR_6g015170 [Medicago truncatula]|uniref:Uncharacterized protein n=1 Tax=Medicago truncatula TaxID=3880 RepID=G7KMQ2_MEDTR|nr:hypothetical protein MTR_6g015170 [Medicago truncatula]